MGGWVEMRRIGTQLQMYRHRLMLIRYCTYTDVSANLLFIMKFSDVCQYHLPPAIRQFSGKDVPDQHGIGVHIHHHVVLGIRLHGVSLRSYILWGAKTATLRLLLLQQATFSTLALRPGN